MALAIFIPLAFLLATSSAMDKDWTINPSQDQVSNVVQISIKGGGESWAIDSSNRIFWWNGSYPGKWQERPLPGDVGAANVGASPDGWTWAISKSDGIFRWNVKDQKWEQISGHLVQVNAISRDLAIGVNRQGDIWHWKNNQFNHMGNNGRWAAIGDEEEKWVVVNNGSIYRWEKEQWAKKPGSAVTIDVQGPKGVVINEADGTIRFWKRNRWQQVPGAGYSATTNGFFINAIEPAKLKSFKFV